MRELDVLAEKGKRLLVLSWHNIEGTWCFPASSRSGARGLEKQLSALRSLANVVPLGWALDTLSNGQTLPARAVSITFDDGYRDSLTVAAPLLEKFELAATCFLVPAFLSRDVFPWWERLAWAFSETRLDYLSWTSGELALYCSKMRYLAFRKVVAELKSQPRRNRESAVDELVKLLAPHGEYCPLEQFLDWDGARELQNYMEIGSHSMFHSILSKETIQVQYEDLYTSRQQLSAKLDADVQLLAYPNGAKEDYNCDTVVAAGRAGYSYALTTEFGWNYPSTPPYEVRRWELTAKQGVVDFVKILRDLALVRQP